MMKLSAFLLLTLPLFAATAYGQNDQEAIKILDKFADKGLKAPSVSMKFKLVTVNQADNTKDTLAGSVILTKDKYKLTLPDNTIWFNGETSWSYLPAEQEVTITKANKKDNTFQSRPSLIFTMYKKDYKSRLIENKTDSYVVDLYPMDIKSDILRIRLTIGKSFLNLISLEYKRRDGIINILNVSEYDLKIIPEASTFVFQTEKYKGVEVVDMR
jgi:outer membrane lipoprotein carrier protein